MKCARMLVRGLAQFYIFEIYFRSRLQLKRLLRVYTEVQKSSLDIVIQYRLV